MAVFDPGFRVERLVERPEGYPDRGYEFEWEWPPCSSVTAEALSVHVDRFRVTGWERQIDDAGNSRISVRAWPIARRTRRPLAVEYKKCDLGHWHEVVTYDDTTPVSGVAPEIWGTSRDREMQSGLTLKRKPRPSWGVLSEEGSHSLTDCGKVQG